MQINEKNCRLIRNKANFRINTVGVFVQDFEQVEKKSSEHVDFVYGCGKQGTVMHKEVEKAIQCHREIEKEKKKWNYNC